MTHYSHAQAPETLGVWAKNAARMIYKRYKKNDMVPIFIYSGMSGIASATALSLAYSAIKGDNPFGMIYARKKGEKSHGKRIEVSYPNWSDFVGSEPHYFIFVDDFVSSGTTLRYTAETVRKELLKVAKNWKKSSRLVHPSHRPCLDLSKLIIPENYYSSLEMYVAIACSNRDDGDEVDFKNSQFTK